jgi:flagellar basal body-associated protein FliL
MQTPGAENRDRGKALPIMLEVVLYCLIAAVVLATIWPVFMDRPREEREDGFPAPTTRPRVPSTRNPV